MASCCATCKHWTRFGEGALGGCSANDIPHPSGGMEGLATEDFDVCPKWQAKEPTEN